MGCQHITSPDLDVYAQPGDKLHRPGIAGFHQPKPIGLRPRARHRSQPGVDHLFFATCENDTMSPALVGVAANLANDFLVAEQRFIGEAHSTGTGQLEPIRACTRGVRLSGSTWPRWRGSIALPAGAALEYKLVLVRANGDVRWESGANRRATVPADSSQTTLVLVGDAFAF